ncbi:methyltransferase, TIGR00027 family [Amycolatopsis sacchari]|uniref:S-adenosyl-L-methionine-dependent methyltransferase n=1 Tax=Amycolatopsis sacchari TaxID=115433 RepID=A0A1I3KP12_9PSEU|nr:SAM-dependent methyltransferase [Amycolatopsis sacchari]SFI74261.1 methyltransferase, TIGR00027 family [Amycolatopsis sacchari]
MTAPEGVRATALLTTYARAQESARQDRLFDDPWARLFVAEATAFTGAGLPRIGMARDDGISPLWRAFSSYFAVRTPFYDERVRRAVAAGVRQVVLLGASMDTRAYRLGLPGDTTVFELDGASVLDFKNGVLIRHGAEPTCRRVPVPVELREDWAAPLREAGFRPGEPVLWLAEGVLMYFTAEESDRLVATVTGLSGAGARLLTEYPARQVDEETMTRRATDEAERISAMMMAALVRSGPDAGPEEWLRRFGWAAEVTDIAAELRRHGREVPDVFADSADRVPVWLIEAVLRG